MNNKNFTYTISAETILAKLHLAAQYSVQSISTANLKGSDAIIINTGIANYDSSATVENPKDVIFKLKDFNKKLQFQVGIFFKFEQGDSAISLYSTKDSIPTNCVKNEFLELFREYFIKFSGSIAAKGINEDDLVFTRIPLNDYSKQSEINKLIKNGFFIEMDDKAKQQDDKLHDTSTKYKIMFGYVLGFSINN